MLQFCPACRDSAIEKKIVATDEVTATALCPSCEERYEFPYRTLYSLEGAPGTGKSTTAGRLDGDVDLALYEGDANMDLIDDALSWETVSRLDLRSCMALHAAGRQALFVGGMHPFDPSECPESRYFADIRRCGLVCEDADLRERARARGADESEADFCLDINRWYREQGESAGLTVVDTTANSPEAVVEEVRAWIEGA